MANSTRNTKVDLIVVAVLFWFLNRTRTGKSMRAYSDNEDLALLSGINPERVVMNTWLIVAALATVAGILYGLDKSFKPFTYFQLLLPIFASAIVGGLGPDLRGGERRALLPQRRAPRPAAGGGPGARPRARRGAPRPEA